MRPAAFLAASLALAAPAKAQIALPEQDTLSRVVMTAPGSFKAANAAGAWNAALQVTCKPPARSTLMLTMNDGRRDFYSFPANGAPTVDTVAPPGLAFADKKAAIESLMTTLGSRAVDDFSPNNLCRNGQPNKGAAIAILRFISSRPRELDS